MIILLQYRLVIDINYAYFKIHFRFNIYDELLVDKTGRSLESFSLHQMFHLKPVK